MPFMPAGLRIFAANQVVDSLSLHERAGRAAAVLLAREVKASDTVALLLRNDVSFIEASLACQKVGAYCVPINWHFTPDEIVYVLRDCGAKLLVGHTDLLACLEEDVPCPVVSVSPSPGIVSAYGIDENLLKKRSDAPDWNELLLSHEPFAGSSPLRRESLIYTSGTTGNPKGVRRNPATPAQAIAVERMRGEVFGIETGSRVLVTAPLYHTAPNLFAARAVALAERLVLPPRFSAEALLADIEQHRITHLYAVPAMFSRLLALPKDVRDRHDLSSLKFVMHAGGPCAPTVKAAMIDWLGPVIEEYYGSTEAGPITRVSSIEWLKRPGTVGRAIEGVELKIVDEDGRPVSVGAVGEIIARNFNYPDFTYLNRPDDRLALDHLGLLRSGDMGYLDGDWLFLCDRQRDLVISGSVNIYPAEIEAALLALDGVTDCAVFGIPDEEYGEALLAVVQPAQGMSVTGELLQAQLRGRIAAYKVPRYFEFRDSLPREETGKIRKRLLREPYWASAGRSI